MRFRVRLFAMLASAAVVAALVGLAGPVTAATSLDTVPVLSNLSPVHAWVGLKNSDDQGTRFDLYAELLQDGNVVATGLTRCITGISRNPSLAMDVTVNWDSVAPVPVVSTEDLALRLSTRIGTNAGGTKCGAGHNNALGLRVYYDSTARLSRFDMTLGSGPSTNEYLHSNGAACANAPSVGATNLSFDETLPSAVTAAAAKCLDSGGVNFAGGNPLKVIAIWNVLQLYLVNSGPATEFYHVSVAANGDCDPVQKPASLSTSAGTGVQYDSPGYAFSPATDTPSRFSYTVPAGGGFTVPANPNAVILKLWTFSGDGTCPGQLEDQSIDWRVLCSGTCGTDVSLTGAGQVAKPGWQAFDLPAGTPVNSLFSEHAGPPAGVQVYAGDVITLEVSADTWAGIQWSAPNGPGTSSLMIRTK